MIEQVLTMKRTAALCLVGAFCSLNAQAQKIQVKGNIVDGTAEPLIGATVKVKGNASVGAVTDLDGNFSISVPSENSILVFTYVGMKTKEVKIGKKRDFKLSMEDDNAIGEVVVVGYGQQKKASVVGSIAQTTGEVLERAAGVSLETCAFASTVGSSAASRATSSASTIAKVEKCGVANS